MLNDKFKIKFTEETVSLKFYVTFFNLKNNKNPNNILLGFLLYN